MSESYVFFVLSRMFMLTVLFGVANGLVLLPVLLSLVGPKAFEHHGGIDKAAREEQAEVEAGKGSGENKGLEFEDVVLEE